MILTWRNSTRRSGRPSASRYSNSASVSKYEGLTPQELAKAWKDLHQVYAEQFTAGARVHFEQGDYEAIPEAEFTPDMMQEGDKIVVFTAAPDTERGGTVHLRTVLEKYQYPGLYQMREEIAWLRNAATEGASGKPVLQYDSDQ